MKLKNSFLERNHKLHYWMALLASILCILLLLSACSLFPGDDDEPIPTATIMETPAGDAPTPEIVTTDPPPVIDVDDQFEVLVDTVWVLAGYGEASDPIVVEEGSIVTAEFHSDGILNGSGGCNNYQATYQVSGNSLTVDPLISTMMICDHAMDQENEFLAALQSAKSYAVTPEGRLEITYDTGVDAERRLFFVQGQTPLVDTIWVLESFGDPDKPTEVIPGTSIIATFSGESAISGISGCNNYSARYMLDDNEGSISISTPVSTRKNCPNGMEQEVMYLSLLPKAESYQISGSRLQISLAGGEGRLTYTSEHFPLENILWTLISLNGGPVADNAPLTMQFSVGEELTEGIVGGVAGCNNYKANYVIGEDGGMLIDQVLTTFMACTPEVMEIEQSYLNTLSTVESYQILGNQLILNSPLAVLTLIADRTPLEGTKWSLVSFGEVDNLIEPAEKSNFTAQFIRIPDAPSGKVLGGTGCRTYQSTYIASLTEIKINPVTGTAPQDCPADITEQEELFFLGLGSASQYQIVGSLLTVNFGDAGVLNFIAVIPEVDAEPDLSALDGTFWFLTMLDDMAVLLDTEITASFDINSDNVTGTVSGSAGCNTYSSEIQEGFRFATPVVAGSNCEQPVGVMDQERLYIDMLGKARAYSINGELLIIITINGPLVYSANPPEPPEDPTVLLVDRDWYLTSINNLPAIPGKEPSAFFSSNGSLSGLTGCNLYSGRYETEKSNISITPIAKTNDPCEEPMLTQESAFINALQVATAIKISATSLQLVGVNGVLNFSSQPPIPVNPTVSLSPTWSPTSTPTLVAPETPSLTRTPGPQPTKTKAPPEVDTPTPPIAVITSPQDGYDGKVNSAIIFDASGSKAEAGIAKYTWDFGDGDAQVETASSTIEHAYEVSGFYTITLTVTDINGVVSEPANINIRIELP